MITNGFIGFNNFHITIVPDLIILDKVGGYGVLGKVNRKAPSFEGLSPSFREGVSPLRTEIFGLKSDFECFDIFAREYHKLNVGPVAGVTIDPGNP